MNRNNLFSNTIKGLSTESPPIIFGIGRQIGWFYHRSVVYQYHQLLVNKLIQLEQGYLH